MIDAGFRPNPQGDMCGAIAPPLLMRPLIDGSAWTGMLRSGFRDEIHLPSFTYQSTEFETGITSELSLHCYSDQLNIPGYMSPT